MRVDPSEAIPLSIPSSPLIDWDHIDKVCRDVLYSVAWLFLQPVVLLGRLVEQLSLSPAVMEVRSLFSKLADQSISFEQLSQALFSPREKAPALIDSLPSHDREIARALLNHEGLTLHLPEVLKGANVQIALKPLYDLFSAHPHSVERRSSHASLQGTCKAIHSELFGELLFWISPENKVHFQLERSPLGRILDTLCHFSDYLLYKITNQQQGPFGSSPLTDKRPIKVD